VTHPQKVKIISRKNLLTDFLSVEEAILQYEKFSGQMSASVRRLKLDRGDSAAILLYDSEQDAITLVDQFRWPTYDNGDGWILEIVAGGIGAAESPEQAAQREAYEETGFTVTRAEPIATFYVSPGGSSERIYLFCGFIDAAARSGAGGGIEAEGEDVRVCTFPRARVIEMLSQGKIADAKTIVALMWLRDRLA
jgi:nudix-type nucleoside diphosphatase (YffH/AdpP family)